MCLLTALSTVNRLVGDFNPPPVGSERLSKPAGNTPFPLTASRMAAVDPQLAIVIEAWNRIASHCRSIIIGMARKAISEESENHSA